MEIIRFGIYRLLFFNSSPEVYTITNDQEAEDFRTYVYDTLSPTELGQGLKMISWRHLSG